MSNLVWCVCSGTICVFTCFKGCWCACVRINSLQNILLIEYISGVAQSLIKFNLSYIKSHPWLGVFRVADCAVSRFCGHNITMLKHKRHAICHGCVCVCLCGCVCELITLKMHIFTSSPYCSFYHCQSWCLRSSVLCFCLYILSLDVHISNQQVLCGSRFGALDFQFRII